MIYFEAQDVCKNFANHTALDRVSIQVKEQSIFGLLGPNGAGKTTLIRIINQIIGPDSGRLLIKGHPLDEQHTEDIGYLPEERGLYKKMKVGEQALYLAQLKGISKSDAYLRLKQWFEKFGIEDWWNRRVDELSKGMQQKVQFIITVIHAPSLLIFDEPFSGFDPINAEMLKEEILQLKEKGATIIFSTHNMASVEELCDDIALINQSKVILSGNVQQIKKQHSSNIYQLKLRGVSNCDDSRLSPLGIISAIEHKEDFCSYRVELNPGVNSNDLLKASMEIGHVTSFEELMPSMNDIFISEVTGNKIHKKSRK
ncbi:MAG: ABC transporter ATP-binding protein [Bacteroidetes bacterium GWF2_43_63]|nr:MAG: ABC transporter ATP-binding protein [Bacteroidetes bacterium GWE2_42_42]OFY53579.1 MAG: ABC transporter ATP-binding protein [Bacteroidetes bacterium GWF2_43_63]HBG71088.1 ABC transporter ATP-binding protein [Bacteroidales bacterium]HCB63666.1 ABC transporter ATP-binding protein [Bacteroidales bacterium]HCY24415.1 ABC transporter ATP-binding protein [Bacteroidales bacterium]